MAYKKFTLQKVVYDFALELVKIPLFGKIKSIPMTDSYKKVLNKGLKIALPSGTEKVRNELIVMPILLEVQDLAEERISIHSGVVLNADRSKGLVNERV